MTVVCTYLRNNGSEYLAFLESPAGVLEGSPPGDSVVLPGDVNTHMDNDSETWRGVIRRNGLLDLNLSCVVGLLWKPQCVHNEHHVRS